MITIAKKFVTDSNDTVYITQFVENKPTGSDGKPIAPQSMTTLWEVIETINGYVARPKKMARVQESAASGYSRPSGKPVPEEHIEEMKKTLIFDLPITNSNEIIFEDMLGNTIRQNEDPVEQ